MTLFDQLLPFQRRFVKARKNRKMFISSRQIGKSTTLGFQLCRAALTSPAKLALAVSVNLRSSHEIILKAAKFAEAAKALSNGQLDF